MHSAYSPDFGKQHVISAVWNWGNVRHLDFKPIPFFAFEYHNFLKTAYRSVPGACRDLNFWNKQLTIILI
jgi:hypothetical protein